MMEPSNPRLWTLARRPKGPLKAYLEPFAQLLVRQGFQQKHLGRQIRVAAAFSRWLQIKKVAAPDVTDSHVRRFLARQGVDYRVKQGGSATVNLLMEFLRHEGITGVEAAFIELTPVQQIVREFGRDLVEKQSLAARTRVQYCPVIELFLAERFGQKPIDLAELCGADVIRFIRGQAARLSPPRAKVATIALRSFLRYARYRGLIKADLVAAVPTVPNWSLTGIPRAISADHVRAALANCRRDTPAGSRDYAILLLLARLGLRAGEIVSLTLDSAHWDRGSIDVSGKGNGGRTTQLPLPVEVGTAIAHYLRIGRHSCSSRSLFLRAQAPFRGLGSTTIGTIVNAALTRAGVDTPHRGAHQFRHALAADMLRQGATLTEIGSLLRHRHARTTSMYAKVDFVALRPLSLPWPGAAS